MWFLYSFMLNSYDDHVHERYKEVRDRLKHFCGLEIDVREKPHRSRDIQKSEESEREESKENERGENRDGITMADKTTGYDAANKQSTSLLQVLATFTKQSGQQHRKFKIPLSGLSGGQVELVMVFCAVFLSEADNLLLDEPGHSLHPPMQAQLRRYLEEQRPPGQTCVVVSHSVEFISDGSLRCLYHMSASGTGFISFRLLEEKAPDDLPQRNRSPPAAAEGPSNVRTASEKGQSTKMSAAGIRSTAASGERAPSPVASNDRRAPCGSRMTLSQNTISMLMKSDMRKMFFATGVYFVEGISDQRVLTAFRHILLEKARVVLRESENVGELYEALQIQRMDRWDIIPLHGCGNAIKAYRAAEALRIPCAFILDFDAVTSKEDGEILAFTKAWKRSTIFKELECLKKALPSSTLAQDESSSTKFDEELARILDEVDEQIFKQNVSEEEGAKKIRELLKNHRIFVWKTDLEGAILSNEAAAEKLQDILQTARREPSSSHEQASQTMLGLAERLVNELKAHKNPTREAQKLIKKLWKENQGSNTKTKSGGERHELGQRLHDHGGWTRLSWEDLLEVVKSGLESGKPLDELKSFVIQTQSKAEKKEHELPPDVKHRILRSLSRK